MNFLYWGSEPGDITPVGNVSVDTTPGRFDPNVACGLSVPAQTATMQVNYWRSIGQFSATAFTLSTWFWTNASNGFISVPQTNVYLLRLLDESGVPRIIITNYTGSGGTGGPAGPFVFGKVSAAGAFTQLGASFPGFAPSALQRLTVAVNYAVGGSISIKIGDADISRYDGDVTTDGVVALGGFDLGQPSTPSGSNTGAAVWSAPIMGDFDCTSIELCKLALTGAGADSEWAGMADGSTINSVTLDTTDGIDSSVAGQLQLFTQSGTLAPGTWSILGIGMMAYASASPAGTALLTAADTASGSVLPFTSTSGVSVGDLVTGTNIPEASTSDPLGIYVESIDVDTSITLSGTIAGDVATGETITFHTPMHMDFVLQIGTTDYDSPPQLPGPIPPPIPPSLGRVAYCWLQSPATGQLLSSDELSSLQVGVRSVT